jgi:hypothetical protein
MSLLEGEHSWKPSNSFFICGTPDDTSPPTPGSVIIETTSCIQLSITQLLAIKHINLISVKLQIIDKYLVGKRDQLFLFGFLGELNVYYHRNNDGVGNLLGVLKSVLSSHDSTN